METCLDKLIGLRKLVYVENNEGGLAHQSKFQAVLQAETLAQQSKPGLDVESGCTSQAS